MSPVTSLLSRFLALFCVGVALFTLTNYLMDLSTTTEQEQLGDEFDFELEDIEFDI